MSNLTCLRDIMDTKISFQLEQLLFHIYLFADNLLQNFNIYINFDQEASFPAPVFMNFSNFLGEIFI